MRSAVVNITKQPTADMVKPIKLHFHPSTRIWAIKLTPINKNHPNQERIPGLILRLYTSRQSINCAEIINKPATKLMD